MTRTFHVTINGTNIKTGLNVLNIEDIVGKKVHTYTYGYRGQYYEATFVVGGIRPRYEFFCEEAQPKTEEQEQELLDKYGYVIVDELGKNTYIFCDRYCYGIFCATDSDRWTIFNFVNE